jgi:hypothetical protein
VGQKFFLEEFFKKLEPFLNERFFRIKWKFVANRKLGFGFKENSV